MFVDTTWVEVDKLKEFLREKQVKHQTPHFQWINDAFTGTRTRKRKEERAMCHMFIGAYVWHDYHEC